MKFAVTIDTEEDWRWEDGFPVEAFNVNNISHLPRFHDLCQKYGISTTYFTDHAVFADPKSAAVVTELAQTNGTEIGMHMHPWTTPPLSPDDNATATSFLENLPPEVGTEKLAATYQLMKEHGLPLQFSWRALFHQHHPKIPARSWIRADASVSFSTWSDTGTRPGR